MKRSETDGYVHEVMRAKTKPERRAALEHVPFHLRAKVRAQVEWQWRQANTRSK